MEGERIVQIIPGGGWRVAYGLPTGYLGDIEAHSYPVLAWGLTESGQVVPLETDIHGFVQNATEASNFISLVPPDPEERRERGLDEMARTRLGELG